MRPEPLTLLPPAQRQKQPQAGTQEQASAPRALLFLKAATEGFPFPFVTFLSTVFPISYRGRQKESSVG